ncbi:hypothetical protein GOV03_03945 [Candidatus Woesearchaeota archaeon]|nr:hypothetical protein [Candidatus Woesearchaeota archaeon]
MPRFERRDRNRDSSDKPSRGGDRGRRSFSDRPRRDSGSYSGRDSGRDRGPRSFGGRREVTKTKVICSACGSKCEVPFKPTSNKPVFCSDCFSKQNKGGSGKSSSRDLDVINEKLNKIMAALKIE